MQYTLLAVHPFDQAEKQILDLREQIFKLTGWASALALPPVIPLVFLPNNLKVHAVREVLAACKPDWDLCATEIISTGTCLYLGTHSVDGLSGFSGLLEKLMAVRRSPVDAGIDGELPSRQKAPNAHQKLDDAGGEGAALPVHAATSLLQPINGFFLAMHEGAADIAQLQALWPAGERLLINPYQVVMLRINVPGSQERWWQNVNWEIVLAVKQRKVQELHRRS